MNKTLEKEKNYYLLSDKVVKKLFTNGSKASKNFLYYLISEILHIPESKLKEDFEIIHPEIGINEKNINSEADIVIKTKEAFISLEFNYGNYKELTAKNFSYVCLLYLRQIKNKKDYKELNDVYSINLDGFDYFGENEFIYKSELMEMKLKKPRNVKIHYIDLNLEHIRKIGYNDIGKEKSKLKRRLYIFVCNDEALLDELYKEDEMMKEIKKEAKQIASELDELMYYDRDKLLEECRYNSVYEEGFDEGKIEGLNEGLAKGKAESLTKVAKKMLKRKNSIKEIIELTGLTKEEIEKLKKE